MFILVLLTITVAHASLSAADIQTARNECQSRCNGDGSRSQVFRACVQACWHSYHTARRYTILGSATPRSVSIMPGPKQSWVPAPIDTAAQVKRTADAAINMAAIMTAGLIFVLWLIGG